MAERPATAQRRAAIARAAEEVFHRDGFAAVGIDAIAAEAEVALGTLYRHYRGKSDLVVGALENREQRFFAFLEQAAAGLAGAERVLALFDGLAAWAAEQPGEGCLFYRAANAHPRETAVRAVVLAHKRAYLALIRRRLLEGGWSAAQAEALAPTLFLLLEGADASERVLGQAGRAQARGLAGALLAASPPEPAPNEKGGRPAAPAPSPIEGRPA